MSLNDKEEVKSKLHQYSRPANNDIKFDTAAQTQDKFAIISDTADFQHYFFDLGTFITHLFPPPFRRPAMRDKHSHDETA